MKLTFQPRVDVAIGKYVKTLDLICSSPGMGRPIPGKDAREYTIPRIPFSLIYRAKPDAIEVLRIWDQRAD